MHKKIANRGFEEAASHTTRSFSRHGLSRRARIEKHLRNRIAKRAEARMELALQSDT